MEEKKKSWFRRHWILSIFLGLIVLGMIGSLFGRDSEPELTGDVVNEQIKQTPEEVKTCIPNWNCGSWSECGSSETQIRTCTDLNNCNMLTDKPEESQSCIYAYEEEQIEVSIDELLSIFDEYSELTEIQKEELYETEYKGKIIKTSIIVDKLDESSLGFSSSKYVVLEYYLEASCEMYGLCSCIAKAFFPSSEKDKLLEANIGDTIVFTGKLVNYDFGIVSCLEFTDSKVLEIKE